MEILDSFAYLAGISFAQLSHEEVKADVLKDHLTVMLTSVNLFLDQTCTTFLEQELDVLVGNLTCIELSGSFNDFLIVDA